MSSQLMGSASGGQEKLCVWISDLQLRKWEKLWEHDQAPKTKLNPGALSLTGMNSEPYRAQRGSCHKFWFQTLSFGNEVKSRFCLSVWRCMKSAECLRMLFQERLLVNSKPKSVCACVCIYGFVLFRLAHLSLTRSKDPHGPPTYTHKHTHPYIPDGQITGHRENHLQQRLNYTQTSASCWPLLGRDCLLQITTHTHTCLIEEEQTNTWQWLVCLESWKFFLLTLLSKHEVKRLNHHCVQRLTRS